MEIEAKIELEDIYEMQDLERKVSSMLRKDSEETNNLRIMPSLHKIMERNLAYARPKPDATGDHGAFLRIRYETYVLSWSEGDITYYNKTILTHKNKNVGTGVSCREEDEAEVGIPNGGAFENLINKLGLEFFSCYAKQRKVAEFSNGVFVSLDLVAAAEKQFDYLPRPNKNGAENLESYSWRKFVEIEGPSEKEVLEMIKKLGLEGKPIIKESYAVIFREEGRKC